MKHVQGETMEQVIDRLRAGDPDYALRFTLEYRVRLFLSVLDAMSYARAHGVLHRDLKPANIIIGPYGEVTVLDWGIAKPIAKRADRTAPDPLAPTVLDSLHRRLNETHAGQLAGTPLYMSPEQAAGLNDELDERRVVPWPPGVHDPDPRVHGAPIVAFKSSTPRPTRTERSRRTERDVYSAQTCIESDHHPPLIHVICTGPPGVTQSP